MKSLLNIAPLLLKAEGITEVWLTMTEKESESFWSKTRKTQRN
jgi:hypothetical protein